MRDVILRTILAHRWVISALLFLLIIVLTLIVMSVERGCIDCSAKDADIITTLDALRDRSEIVYDNYGSFRNLCSRPFNEGGALDVIETISRDSKNVVCKDGPTSWALEAQLFRGEETHYCVDNTGIATRTNGNTISDARCGE